MKKEKVYLDRLARVADMLDNEITDEQFDLTRWIEKTSCGTVGCAVGWAAQLPEFIEQGFSLVCSDGGVPRPSFKAILEFDKNYCGDYRIGNGYDINYFFGLTLNESNHLFFDAYYPEDKRTRKDVSERIRKLIKDNQ